MPVELQEAQPVVSAVEGGAAGEALHEEVVAQEGSLGVEEASLEAAVAGEELLEAVASAPVEAPQGEEGSREVEASVEEGEAVTDVCLLRSQGVFVGIAVYQTCDSRGTLVDEGVK